MFTNWNRKANKESRLNPLSINDIDALTIATLRSMGTTPEKFRENVKQHMPEDAMEQGEAIMRRNPKVIMPDSHFKLQGAQEQQMMDDIELGIPEFYFDEEAEKTKFGVQEMARDVTTQRALNAYKNTYKDHVMQAFDKHKAFMQSLGNQPMTAQEFMQHPKVPSFTDYYNQAKEGTVPVDNNFEEHPFAITHPEEFIQHKNNMDEQYEIQGYPVSDPFIPVITGEPMDLAMDTLLKFQSAAQRRIYSEIPTVEEMGSMDDVVAMRNIPVHRLESGGMPAFNMPVPLRGTRPGDPLQFERDIHARGGITIPGFTPDYQAPDDPRKELQGTFVYPLDVSSFAPERFTTGGDTDFLTSGYPDMNRGIGDTVTLGILDKPEWRAGQAHGRTQPEGYQPMGFDKDAFVRLDGGLGVSAVGPREEWSALARRLSPAFAEPTIGDEALHFYDYPALYRTLSKLPVTTTASKRNPLTGYKPTNIDFLLDRMGGARVVTGEPMDLAMDALLKNQPYHEMSKDQLNEILYGLGGYDAGTREYSRDETSSTQEEKDAAFNELLARQREADANPVNVFNLDGEEKSRLVDFYEPQFTGQNISPDIFIPQTEEEGQMAFDEGDMEHDVDERLLDIDEFMPGKSFLTEEDPAAKYHHLKATAGDDVAQNYLNRYRDFAMRNSENPEYIHQRLMQMFDDNQEVTAPQYTQEFPTDESIFNVKPPHVMMNEPDATGFAHNWQAKNASEPMDLAIDVLLKDLSPEAKRHKLEYDKKYESSPERVKYREQLNRERRRRGIYGSGDHMDVSHTEGGKLTLEPEHDNRARHFKDKGTLRPSD